MTKVLVIDDSEDVLDLSKRLLRRQFTVYTAANLEKAKGFLTESDVVLLDFNMPEGTGDVLAGEIRQNMNDSAKLLLFSAMDEDVLRRKYKEMGADGYIFKTFERKLIEQVQNYL